MEETAEFAPGGQLNRKKILAASSLATVSVSLHLAVLKPAGPVSSERQGLWIAYTI